MIRSMTLIVIGAAVFCPVSVCVAQEQSAPVAPPATAQPAAAPKNLEIVNEAKIAVVLYPARGKGLIDPPEQITLKPGQTATLKVRADWTGEVGMIQFLPEWVVLDNSAFPYGFVGYTPTNLHSRITDSSIPDPDRDLKRRGKKDPDAAHPKPPVLFPHPLITEVLYAVPTGSAGDANKDGVRDTNGEEFVEIVNPHDKPINLRGYTISGKAPEAPSPGKKFTVLKFVFPNCELAPGEVAVVFNGHGGTWSGPVGDTTHAAGANAAFCNARVFSMKVESARLGFANKADMVLLTAPNGEVVHCITWGEIKAPANCKLVEVAPAVNGQSVFRRTVDGPLEPHPALDGLRFSPGRFPLDATAPESSKTEPATTQPPPPRPPEKKPQHSTKSKGGSSHQ